ncbi:MAG: hypothetical protein ACRBBQ_17150 [Cognatishimia sp.]
MGDLQSVPELVAAAQAKANASGARISEIRAQMGEHAPTGDLADELGRQTLAIEAAAIDVFSAFEKRMQHHFRRGPFSRKLKALLLEHKQADLAGRFHQYYLAVNVLKHGKGASHRELLKTPGAFHVLTSVDAPADDTQPPTSLVDVTVDGFFDELCTTLLEAHQFLEK